MEYVKNLPNVAIWVVALARDVIESSKDATTLETAQDAINKIDEFLLQLRDAAENAKRELENADNADWS